MEDFLTFYANEKDDTCKELRNKCKCNGNNGDNCGYSYYYDAGLDYCTERNNVNIVLIIDCISFEYLISNSKLCISLVSMMG